MVYIIIAIMLLISYLAIKQFFIQKKEVDKHRRKTKKLIEEFEKEYPLNDNND